MKMFFLISFLILYISCYPFIFYFSNKAYRYHSKNFSAFVRSRYNKIYFAIAMLQFGIGFLILNFLFRMYENLILKIGKIDIDIVSIGISLLMTFLILYVIRRYYELKIKRNNETVN